MCCLLDNSAGLQKLEVESGSHDLRFSHLPALEQRTRGVLVRVIHMREPALVVEHDNVLLLVGMHRSPVVGVDEVGECFADHMPKLCLTDQVAGTASTTLIH